MAAPISYSNSLPFRRSGLAFSGMLVLVWIALSFPEMPVQGLLGILWAGAGILMLLLPPEQKLPRAWVLLAAGFVGLAALGFLPREWFPLSPWRADLEALGLPTGRRAFIEPLAAAEALAGFAATAAVVLFLLGHRIDTSWHHALMLAFALAAGVWTVTAMALHEPGKVFGFFPNRNHTACLLAMATFAGLGSLVHAIRAKHAWKIAASLPPPLLTIWALFAFSESRAGLVLLAAGLLVWGLLAGKSVLRGHAGKAVALILIAAVGAFLIGDFTAKQRLADTVSQLTPADTAGSVASDTSESPFAINAAANTQAPRMDARVSIFQATLRMIANEPWTGVGPGRFVSVFTQYRDTIEGPNDSQALHPESDWLMMLAETGGPATLCLVAGVVMVLVFAIRRSRKSRARLLKSAGIVAALLLCLHGIFDLPGHRIGITWAAALLLAMSLRPIPYASDDDPDHTTRSARRIGWRAMGLLLLVGGSVLVAAQSLNQPLLPTAKVHHHLQTARKLYAEDQAAYKKATAEGLEHEPPLDEDPLLFAINELTEAIRITPLDPYLHYFQGALALHFDDRPEIAHRAFAIQRRLDPFRINVGLEQARAWKEQNPDEAFKLWQEAMQRARNHMALVPYGPDWIANTYRTALRDAGNSEGLSLKLLSLADGAPALITEWAKAAPPALLDREMPRLLVLPDDLGRRTALFDLWQRRGSKAAAQVYATTHPHLGLNPRQGGDTR